MNNEATLPIGSPSPEAMESKHVIDTTMLGEGQRFNLAERVEYPEEGGIYVYYKGMPFPKKGYPFPEAAFNNDLMKRITMAFVKSVAVKDLALPVIAFALLPWPFKKRAIENAIYQYSRISEWLFSPAFLKPERYSNPCRSIRKLVNSFMVDLKMEGWILDIFPKTIATIVEYDDAYRYRIEDLMSETTRTALIEKPIREIRRLTKIAIKRDISNEKVRGTISAISLVSQALLLHPKIRRAYRNAVGSLNMRDFRWLQLDNADRYHVLRRGDYNFTGRSLEERTRIYIDFHTHSLCCNAGVLEQSRPAPLPVDLRRNKNDSGNNKKWVTICKRCLKECEWRQEFPPEATVAPQK